MRSRDSISRLLKWMRSRNRECRGRAGMRLYGRHECILTKFFMRKESPPRFSKLTFMFLSDLFKSKSFRQYQVRIVEMVIFFGILKWNIVFNDLHGNVVDMSGPIIMEK